MSRARVSSALAAFVTLAAACGGEAPPPAKHVEAPGAVASAAPRATQKPRETPPPSGAAKESPFPKVTRTVLPNGLAVASAEAHALPLVQVRLLVHAGMGYGAPGAAEITAQLLKDGGTKSLTSAALLEKIEALGASLSVDVGLDASTFGIAVTKDHLADALGLLAEMITSPRFDEAELKKLKARESDAASDRARSSGSWSATRTLFHELYPTGSPYARYELVPSEIAKVSSATVRDFYKHFYVPKNAELVLVGDVDEAARKTAGDKLAAWTGGDAPKVDFPAAAAPVKRRVFLCNRPKSAQSDVFVARLTVERHAATWPAVRVANQVLGGGVASRLFADVREQRSLAYSARSQIYELAHGAQPMVAYAGTQTEKTRLALDGVLENLAKMPQGVTDVETETARRYLSDIFAIRMETIGSIADLVVLQDALGLPDGTWDKYRAEVRATNAAAASSAGADLVKGPELIVVSGDADAIAQDLTAYGEVTVLDPEAEFKVVRTLPAR